MVSFKPQDKYEMDLLELVSEELLSENPAKYLIGVHRKNDVFLPYRTQPENISELIELPENSKNITITGTMADIRPTKSFNRRDGSGTGCRQQFRLDDNTGSVRVVIWGINENDTIFQEIEDVIYHRGRIEITGGIFKVNYFKGVTYFELHLSEYNYPTINPIID